MTWRTRILAALLGGVVVSSAHGQTVVDEIVATVDGQPVARSRFEFEAELRRAVGATPNPASYGNTLLIPDPEQAVLLRQVLLGGAAPDEGASRAVAQDRVRRLLATPRAAEVVHELLARWGLTEEDLVDWFRSLVRAESVGERRLGRVPDPTPAEVEAEVLRDPSRYPGPLAEVAPAVGSQLLRERIADAWNDLARAVLDRADVRRLDQGGRPPSRAPH